MKLVANIENAKVTTFLNSEKVMTECIVENDTRVCTMSLGRVSKTWTIFLDKKDEDFNRTLRTYTNLDRESAINYFDKKVKEFK